MRAVPLVFACVTGAAPVAAQTLAPAGAFSAVHARVRSELPSGTSQFTGPVLGGQGSLAFGRFGLDVSYVEGTVRPEGGGAAGFALVEGRGPLRLRPPPWLPLPPPPPPPPSP